jgi:hypothetical protein
VTARRYEDDQPRPNRYAGSTGRAGSVRRPAKSPLKDILLPPRSRGLKPTNDRIGAPQYRPTVKKKKI